MSECLYWISSLFLLSCTHQNLADVYRNALYIEHTLFAYCQILSRGLMYACLRKSTDPMMYHVTQRTVWLCCVNTLQSVLNELELWWLFILLGNKTLLHWFRARARSSRKNKFLMCIRIAARSYILILFQNVPSFFIHCILQ